MEEYQKNFCFLDENSKKIYNQENTKEGQLPSSVLLWNKSYQDTVTATETLDLDHCSTVVIYGAGAYGKTCFSVIFAQRPKINLLFCDKNWESKEMFCYCDVISPETLVKDYAHVPVIVAMKHFELRKEVTDFLLCQGVTDFYYFSSQRANPNQPVDIWLPEAEAMEQNQEPYVWLGNAPAQYVGLNYILSQKMIDYPQTEEVFLYSPTQHRGLLGETEKGRTNGKTKQSEYYGFFLRKEMQVQYKEESMDCMDLDGTASFFYLNFLKVVLEECTLPFFKGCTHIINHYRPRISVTYALKEKDSLGQLLDFFQKEFPFYGVCLRKKGENQLVLYAFCREEE